MNDDDILKEIQDLKRDMGSFGDRLVRLRYLDLKDVFVEEMRQALAEEGRRSLDQDMGVIGDTSDCQIKQRCTEQLSAALEAAIRAFEDGDLPDAVGLLDQIEGLLCGSESPCQSEACSRQAADMVRRIRTILAIYMRLSEDLGAKGMSDAIAEPKVPEGRAEDAEKILGPLSNARRIMVLRILRDDRRSLSELGKELDMKTGHLLFHVKALKEAGYIAADRRSRLYSLTAKGRTALACVEDMLAKLSEHDGALAPQPIRRTDCQGRSVP